MGSCTEDGPGAVRAVMERYVESVYTADVETLRGLFHAQAVMNGYLGEDLLIGTPEPFFADLAGRPSMAESNHPYEAKISAVDAKGKAATATLIESGFFGVHSFVNYYHLLLIDREWKITSKTFAAV